MFACLPLSIVLHCSFLTLPFCTFPHHAYLSPSCYPQDQLRAMRAMLEAAFGDQAPPVDVYDGDTAQADRPGIRARAQLLITNPDMLHLSILPVHSTFARFLRKLRFVVVDEGHAYRCEAGCLCFWVTPFTI